MKGFIEVTPMTFEMSYDVDNPFNGEYVESANKITLGISTITLIEGSYIRTDMFVNTQYGDSILDYKVKESYEEIKELIKKAQ